jgi:fluoroquinolone transport system permease protein
MLYVVPAQGPMLLLGAAFDQITLAPWQSVYAVVYPVIWIAGLCWVAKTMFSHYVIAESGGM